MVFVQGVVAEVLVLVLLLLLLLLPLGGRTTLLDLVVGLEEGKMGGRVFVKQGLGSLGLLICACVSPMSDAKMRTCDGHPVVTST